jgi:hypothetical protein
VNRHAVAPVEWTKANIRELKTLAREKTPVRTIAANLGRTEVLVAAQIRRKMAAKAEPLLRLTVAMSWHWGLRGGGPGVTGDAVRDVARLFEKAAGDAKIPGGRKESNAVRIRGSPTSIGWPRSSGPGSQSRPDLIHAHVVNHDASRSSVERDTDGPARRGLRARGRSFDIAGRRRVAPPVGRPARIQQHSRFGPGRSSDRSEPVRGSDHTEKIGQMLHLGIQSRPSAN